MRNRLVSLAFAAVVVALFAFSSTIRAQAPTDIPRTPDGKPDFSGLWVGGGGGAADFSPVRAATGAFTPSAAPISTTNPSGESASTIARRPTRTELARELPLTPWGQEQVTYRVSGDGEYGGETGTPEDPRYHNLCGGPKSAADLGAPVEITQNPYRLFLVHLGNTRTWVRQFWIGREHPEDPTNYNASWMGHSVARWEGDTLVVDTIGIKEGALLDTRRAAPQSDQLHMVERYQLISGQTMRVDRTFADPKAYTRAWTDSKTYSLMTDWDTYAGEWEVVDQHTVCVGGIYSEENDPWFENYDEIKVLPNAQPQ